MYGDAVAANRTVNVFGYTLCFVLCGVLSVFSGARDDVVAIAAGYAAAAAAAFVAVATAIVVAAAVDDSSTSCVCVSVVCTRIKCACRMYILRARRACRIDNTYSRALVIRAECV